MGSGLAGGCRTACLAVGAEVIIQPAARLFFSYEPAVGKSAFDRCQQLTRRKAEALLRHGRFMPIACTLPQELVSSGFLHELSEAVAGQALRYFFVLKMLCRVREQTAAVKTYTQCLCSVRADSH